MEREPIKYGYQATDPDPWPHRAGTLIKLHRPRRCRSRMVKTLYRWAYLNQIPPYKARVAMEEDPGVQMECTCGACPEQYEGTVDGNPAYFRLRHSWWRFCIIEPGGDPVGPGSTPEKKVLYYKEGEYEPGQDAGIMEDARGLIMSMVEEFRKAQLSLSEEELMYWLNAVVDAQTEYETIPEGDRKLCMNEGEDGPDEYWGFFSEWRRMIIDECYNAAFPPGSFPEEKAC